MQNRKFPKESFVVFIDILGFSQLIEEDRGTGNSLSVLKKALKSATAQLRKRKRARTGIYKYWFAEFSVKSFSDCFCFSIPLEFRNGEKDYIQNFISFCTWLHVFYHEMLKSGYACRGAITHNWHYEDRDMIFSKGLVDTYLLESKKAVNPMIMVHPDLIAQLQAQIPQPSRLFNFMFSHDSVGRTFFNMFNYSIVDEMNFYKNNYSEEKEQKDISDRNELINMHLKTIEDRIAKLKGQAAVEKWQWLKEYALFVRERRYDDKFFDGLHP